MSRKSPEPRRAASLLLGLSAEERAELDAAARAESLPTGTWLRALGLRVARGMTAGMEIRQQRIRAAHRR